MDSKSSNFDTVLAADIFDRRWLTRDANERLPGVAVLEECPDVA